MSVCPSVPTNRHAALPLLRPVISPLAFGVAGRTTHDAKCLCIRIATRTWKCGALSIFEE